jgi:hypothetical protein
MIEDYLRSRPLLHFLIRWLLGPFLVFYLGSWTGIAALPIALIAGNNRVLIVVVALAEILLVGVAINLLYRYVYPYLRRLFRKPVLEETIPLVRFWREYRDEFRRVQDINFENFTWTIRVPNPEDGARAGDPAKAPALSDPAGMLSYAAARTRLGASRTRVLPEAYPGLIVESPRCPNCNLPIQESRFRGGYYRKCSACDFCRISRRSLRESEDWLERLALQGWWTLVSKEKRAGNE